MIIKKGRVYIFLEEPLGFAVRFGKDALEDDLLVLVFFDGQVDERLHETLCFLLLETKRTKISDRNGKFNVQFERKVY